MKVTLVRQSRTREQHVSKLLGNYQTRIRHWMNLEVIEQKRSVPVCLSPGKYLVALDERGKQTTSEEFARFLRMMKEDPAISNLTFVVGGAHGMDHQTLTASHRKISLSKMVLPGDLAWLFLHEQVYRGLSILAGSPYHHG